MNPIELPSFAFRIPMFARLVNQLKKRESYSTEVLQEYQTRKLLEGIRFCHAHVPFYRARWAEAGINIGQIQSKADVNILPYTTKDDLKQYAGQMVPDFLPRKALYSTRTGGSTGSPANFYRTLDCRMTEFAFFLRYWRWIGMNFWWDRKAWWRGSFEIEKKDVLRGPFGTYKLSAFDLTDEKLRRYAELIASKKIRFLMAYPSLAERLAWVVRRDDSLRRKLQLRVIFCMSEKLYPRQREIIEAVFSCPVRIHYGHGEMCCLFQQCPEGDGYHVITDYGYAEFSPPDQQTGMREVIGTSFINPATPLIRYRTGDYVTLRDDSSCSCGLPFPKNVDDVVGRSGDVIITPGGRYVHANHLEFAIRFIEHFSDCQIIQDALDHLTVLVVPEKGYSQQEGELFGRAILDRLGETLQIDIEEVDQIPRTMNQKRKFLVSKLEYSMDSQLPLAS